MTTVQVDTSRPNSDHTIKRDTKCPNGAADQRWLGEVPDGWIALRLRLGNAYAVSEDGRLFVVCVSPPRIYGVPRTWQRVLANPRLRPNTPALNHLRSGSGGLRAPSALAAVVNPLPTRPVCVCCFPPLCHSTKA